VALLVPEPGPSGALQLVRRLCRLCIFNIAADYPERCLLLGCREGKDTAYPCTTCTVTCTCEKCQLCGPYFGARGLPLRLHGTETERRQRLRAALAAHQRGAVGPANKEATAHSLHIADYDTALEGLDFGAPPLLTTGGEIFARHNAVQPGWMHVVYEGLGKQILGWICQLSGVSACCLCVL